MHTFVFVFAGKSGFKLGVGVGVWRKGVVLGKFTEDSGKVDG